MIKKKTRLWSQPLSTLLGGALLICATHSFADNCDQTRNTYDDVYCTNKIYASADADLNKNYQALRAKLNNSQKNILKRSQLGWIRERDQNCVSGTTVDVQCRLESTQDRNHWLIERLRECKTVGVRQQRLMTKAQFQLNYDHK